MNYPVLISGTIIIIVFSWFLSIKHKRYHGIARFFSFESIFLLVMLNYSAWFIDPFSLLQIISWVTLILSGYVGILGFYILKKHGKADTNFENTSVVVKESIYEYIRHPLYFSLFLVGTGVMIKDPQPAQLVLGFVNLVAVYLTALIEEKEMISKFGNQYSEYMKETKMFIPYII
jgi:protein-S-isoprenylcysteine O-methyltransferase Ste14